jgi:hypothetical protein
VVAGTGFGFVGSIFNPPPTPPHSLSPTAGAGSLVSARDTRCRNFGTLLCFWLPLIDTIYN